MQWTELERQGIKNSNEEGERQCDTAACHTLSSVRSGGEDTENFSSLGTRLTGQMKAERQQTTLLLPRLLATD